MKREAHGAQSTKRQRRADLRAGLAGHHHGRKRLKDASARRTAKEKETA